MAKYGISRDFKSNKKSGIFRYFLLFLLAIFLLLILLSVFDKVGGFKNLFSSKPNEAEVVNINIEESELGVIKPLEPVAKPALAIDTIKISKKGEQDKIVSDAVVPELVVSDLPENDSLNVTEKETGVKVYGNIDDISTDGFKVDGVMAIHKQVPDLMLIKPFIMRHILENGTALEFMSDSLEAKLLNVLAADNTTAEPLVLEQVFFYYNSDRLKRQSYVQIKNIAKIIVTYPQAKILIRGHTDNNGDKQYNKTLSLKRAKVAKKSLVARGVSPNNIQVLGIGQSESLVSNDNPVNRRKNRRIDISIVK